MPMWKTLRSYTTIVAVLGAALSSLACNSLVDSGNIPADAPSLVVPMIGDSSQFAQTGSETLAGVAPGTVIDDLSGLSGCYGAYSVECLFGFTIDGNEACRFGCVDVYEAFSFDTTTGQGRHAVLMGAFGGSGSEGSFTFTVTGSDRIRTRHEYADGTIEELDALVTLSGTELKITYIYENGNTSDELSSLVFRKFACP